MPGGVAELNRWADVPAHGWWVFSIMVIIGILSVMGLAQILTRMVTDRVIKIVFGKKTLTTIATLTKQTAEAHQASQVSIRATEQANNLAIQQALGQSQAELAKRFQAIQTEMADRLEDVTEQIREGRIPLTIAVSTSEDRQTLEAIINRARPQVIVRSMQPRKTKADIAHEDMPTAWSRILRDDDDEEGLQCPKTEQEPQPTKKLPKPKPPKSVSR